MLSTHSLMAPPPKNTSRQLRDGFGMLSKLAGPRLPGIPGGDVAGVVAEADEGSPFKPGGLQAPRGPAAACACGCQPGGRWAGVAARPRPSRPPARPPPAPTGASAGDRVFGLIKWSVGGYVSKVGGQLGRRHAGCAVTPSPASCGRPSAAPLCPGSRAPSVLRPAVPQVVLPEADLARVPEGMSFEEAAATPLAALTAWQVRLHGCRAVLGGCCLGCRCPCCRARASLTGALWTLQDPSRTTALLAFAARPWPPKPALSAVPCTCTCPGYAQALDLARAKAGDRVLVHAGAGGVGTFAIQVWPQLSSLYRAPHQHSSCAWQLNGWPAGRGGGLRAARSAALRPRTRARPPNQPLRPVLRLCPLTPSPPPCARWQLAKARGCWVATTCSGGNADFVRGLGADAVVDYTKEAFEGEKGGWRGPLLAAQMAGAAPWLARAAGWSPGSVPRPITATRPASLAAPQHVPGTSRVLHCPSCCAEALKGEPFDSVLDAVVLRGYEQRRWARRHHPRARPPLCCRRRRRLLRC